MRAVRRRRLRLHRGSGEDAAAADAAAGGTRCPPPEHRSDGGSSGRPRARSGASADPIGPQRVGRDEHRDPDDRRAGDRSTGGSRRLTFHGSGGTLFGIYVVNILLTIVTFGFYRFWGKVKIRRFMLSQTGFEGDRFAYHGTGKELLHGFAKAVLFVGMPITALSAAARLSRRHDDPYRDSGVHVAPRPRLHPGRDGWGSPISPEPHLVARNPLLVPRPRMGVRQDLHAGLALSAVTLSLYYPFFQTKQQRS